MFNGLASFFFGAVGAGGPSVVDCALTTSNDLSSSTSINYTTTETEGDWLLVESSKRRSQGNVSGLSGGHCIDVPNAIRSSPPPPPASSSSSSSSVPSSPTSGIMLLDGSWYITPPPCFTADSPTNVETSPMENLLIEHPSMSVYASNCTNPALRQLSATLQVAGGNKQGRLGRNRRKPPVRKCGQASNSTSSGVVVSPAKDELVDVVTPTKDSAVVDDVPLESIENVQGPACQGPIKRPALTSAATVAAREELLLHVEIQAQSQKAIRERDNRGVHRRQLERQNKVQEYQSLGKRQRRKDFMKNHSGANNNRKC